jgi:hypothetical protein
MLLLVVQCLLRVQAVSKHLPLLLFGPLVAFVSLTGVDFGFIDLLN